LNCALGSTRLGTVAPPTRAHVRKLAKKKPRRNGAKSIWRSERQDRADRWRRGFRRRGRSRCMQARRACPPRTPGKTPAQARKGRAWHEHASLEHTVKLEPEVLAKPARGVLLDDKRMALGCGHRASARFAGPFEIALCPIRPKSHGACDGRTRLDRVRRSIHRPLSGGGGDHHSFHFHRDLVEWCAAAVCIPPFHRPRPSGRKAAINRSVDRERHWRRAPRRRLSRQQHRSRTDSAARASSGGESQASQPPAPRCWPGLWALSWHRS
jgi:hypothetical protein